MSLFRRNRDTSRDRDDQPVVGRHRRRFPAVQRMVRGAGEAVEPRHRMALDAQR